MYTINNHFCHAELRIVFQKEQNFSCYKSIAFLSLKFKKIYL